jgi:hypothetical protein
VTTAATISAASSTSAASTNGAPEAGEGALQTALLGRLDTARDEALQRRPS